MVMDPINRAERVVALKAIASKAEEMEGKGYDPIEVKTFTVGAKRKLAEERPDYGAYVNAAKAAGRAKATM
jgi:hypothetical protein